MFLILCTTLSFLSSLNSFIKENFIVLNIKRSPSEAPKPPINAAIIRLDGCETIKNPTAKGAEKPKEIVKPAPVKVEVKAAVEPKAKPVKPAPKKATATKAAPEKKAPVTKAAAEKKPAAKPKKKAAPKKE